MIAVRQEPQNLSAPGAYKKINATGIRNALDPTPVARWRLRIRRPQKATLMQPPSKPRRLAGSGLKLFENGEASVVKRLGRAALRLIGFSEC